MTRQRPFVLASDAQGGDFTILDTYQSVGLGDHALVMGGKNEGRIEGAIDLLHQLEDFLAALAQMPAASGIALGFDRLVMLATSAPRIDDVIWTPVSDQIA